MRCLPLALTVLLLGGCARYEFDINRPGAASLAVTHQAETKFSQEPLAYRAIAKEDRLVLLIRNTLAIAVELDGEKSAVVDALGHRHPLRSQTLAPAAQIRLILPPLRPRFEEERRGTFSIGVQANAPQPAQAQPVYLDYYSETDIRYWEWDGESTIQLLLVFRTADGQTWSHEFKLQKRKA